MGFYYTIPVVINEKTGRHSYDGLALRAKSEIGKYNGTVGISKTNVCRAGEAVKTDYAIVFAFQNRSDYKKFINSFEMEEALTEHAYLTNRKSASMRASMVYVS